MPTETWHNLPQDKRASILLVANREFAAKGYANASLNKIAEEAMIAKGSLFQYFENKLDLWETITGHAADRIWGVALRAVGPAEDGLFDRLERLSLAWIRHLRDNLIDRAFSAATIDATDRPARDAIRRITNQLYSREVGKLVGDAIERDEIDPDLGDDIATMAILILRFLGSAAFVGDRDPILDLHTKEWPEIEAKAIDLVGVLRRAFSN